MTLCLFTIFLTAFWGDFSYSSDKRPGEQIIAAQIFYTPTSSIYEFEKELIEMKKKGINTIIFRVFGNQGDRIYGFVSPQNETGVYFHTTHAPVIEDILGAVTFLAHNHGLKIYAWMTTRHATYGQSPRLLDSQFNLSSGKVEQIPKLDLFNPLSIRHLEGIFTDLAKYPLDGVLFQDDFVIKHMEAASPYAKRAYLNRFGKTLSLDNMFVSLRLKPNGRVSSITYTSEFWQWAGFKSKRLAKVGQRLIGLLKVQNPGLSICLNTYYEMYREPQNSLAWMSHDFELANSFDCVAMMAYNRQIMDELDVGKYEAEEVVLKATKNAVRIFGKQKVIVKSQTIDWKDRTPIPNHELQRVYESIQTAAPGVGTAFAPWEGQIELNLNNSY